MYVKGMRAFLRMVSMREVAVTMWLDPTMRERFVVNYGPVPILLASELLKMGR